MINEKTLTRLMRLLIADTNRDKIVWENMMLNIHETIFRGKNILTDWPQDDSPMISIDGNVLEMRGIGIEELRKCIDEQYKRLKKYRYSEESRAASAAIESRRQREQLQNDQSLNTKMSELLVTKTKSGR